MKIIVMESIILYHTLAIRSAKYSKI